MFEIQTAEVDKMRKIILESDSIVIDGKEFTHTDIQQALINSLKYEKLSDFLQSQFGDGGVPNE